jgi:F-type H+-transporting ATPase subunit a
VSGKGCLIALVMLVLVAVLCSISSGFLGALGGGNTGLLHSIGLDPILPTIKLPAEMVVPLGHVGPFKVGLTNTMIETIIVDILLVALAAAATAKIRAGSKEAWVPRGLQNLFEVIIEALYGLAESVLGKRAKQVFWLGATIFLFVLFANWLELFPGVDSVGILEHPHEPGIAYSRNGALLSLPEIQNEPPGKEAKAAEGVTPGQGAGTGEGGQHGKPEQAGEVEHEFEGWELIPFVRAAATDLNVTLALAIISVVMTQVYGFRAQGVQYLGKFMATRRLGQGNAMGLIDLIVGALEGISEFAKIISFTFRLFGNIFAGQVLLFVMVAFLIPFLVFGTLIFYGLEVFVGLIQAVVFMMLTFVFIAMATAGHGGEEHAGHSEAH